MLKVAEFIALGFGCVPASPQSSLSHKLYIRVLSVRMNYDNRIFHETSFIHHITQHLSSWTTLIMIIKKDIHKEWFTCTNTDTLFLPSGPHSIKEESFLVDVRGHDHWKVGWPSHTPDLKGAATALCLKRVPLSGGKQRNLWVLSLVKSPNDSNTAVDRVCVFACWAGREFNRTAGRVKI